MHTVARSFLGLAATFVKVKCMLHSTPLDDGSTQQLQRHLDAIRV